MKGILLHPLRLKALSEGRLSVLRVPFREQPERELVLNAAGEYRYADREGIDSNSPTFKPPYVPGDYFVKEAWAWVGDGHDEPFIVYRATNPDQGCRWNPARTMVEHLSRYILTLGPPVPGKLGEVDENTIYAEGVYFPPPYIGVNYEDGSAIEHPDIAMDPWQHHERFWNTIYPRHPWSPDRWTWAYPVRRRR